MWAAARCAAFAGDADLRRGDSHPLREGVNLGDALPRGEEVIHDPFCGIPLGGEPEGACWLTKDGGAYLDDSEVAHLLTGPHLIHSNSP